MLDDKNSNSSPHLRVAVYGSLKRGFYNHHYLHTAVFEGKNQTAPDYTMIDLGDYPGVVSGGQTSIQVEIYRVSPRVLSQLDRLEGVPQVYRRTSITLPDLRSAFFYCLTPGYLRRLGSVRRRVIPSGIWR